MLKIDHKKSEYQFMVWIAVNSEEPPIWFIPDIPVGQNGMQTEQYIEVLENFTSELQNRGLNPHEIVFQQVNLKCDQKVIEK